MVSGHNNEILVCLNNNCDPCDSWSQSETCVFPLDSMMSMRADIQINSSSYEHNTHLSTESFMKFNQFLNFFILAYFYKKTKR